MQTYEISLDMRKGAGRIERTVVVRRGDNDTQQISAAITAGGKPYAPRGAARLDILHADGTWARATASLSGSTVSCTLPDKALNGVGRCRAAHFVFTDGAKVESTEGFALVIVANVATEGTPGAQGYDDELEAMKAAWRKFSDGAEKAETARVSAETSRASAEGKRVKSEEARANAETARVSAETKRVQSETSRAGAETARAKAEASRVTEEGKRASAEAARAAAETKRASAESGRVTEEGKRAQAEAARAAAETKRASAESGRVTEEGKRASAEAARVKAESGRTSAETARAAAEAARAKAETTRAQAEAQRAGSESKRASAEQTRTSAEAARVKAESTRAQAEAQRKEAQAKNNADQALNNELMKKLTPIVLNSGQYDASSHKPTVTGEPNRVYFVPAGGGQGSNAYVEWMWVGGAWELMGQSTMEVRPISTAQVDAVASGSSPQGDSVLSLTGLSYVWVKLKGAFAALSHRHAASDITSGSFAADRLPVVPVSKGGTGKSSMLESAFALANACQYVTAVPSDDDWYLCSFIDGSNRLARRSITALWDYIKEKTNTLYQPKGSYAAASHAHTTAQVSGLQAALDGKQPKGSYAAASHVHAASEVNGLPALVSGLTGAGPRVYVSPDAHPEQHTDGSFRIPVPTSGPLRELASRPGGDVVLFSSGLAMFTSPGGSPGHIGMDRPVPGCRAAFKCSGSGSSGNGGQLSAEDGGVVAGFETMALSKRVHGVKVGSESLPPLYITSSATKRLSPATFEVEYRGQGEVFAGVCTLEIGIMSGTRGTTCFSTSSSGNGLSGIPFSGGINLSLIAWSVSGGLLEVEFGPVR